MPKKEFTSFDVSAVVYELRQQIIDSRVNNIYQLGPTTFLFKLHKVNGPPLQLVIESGKRLHLTAYVPEKPVHPPDFCMALRKYLRDAWLRDVEQYEFERIANLHFESRTGKFTLVLELFGDGNLILVGENGSVLQALVLKRMRDRNILRGEAYKPPPALGKNPMKASSEELEEIFETFGDAEVVRTLARSLSLGGVYAEEVLARARVEKSRSCKALTCDERKSVYDSLRSLTATLAGSDYEPRIIQESDGTYLDAVPFPLKRYEGANFLKYGTFNEALDEFYLHSTATGKALEFDGKIRELQREAERLRRVVAEQEKSVKESLEKSEHEKSIGDIIYAHSVELQSLLNLFLKAKEEGRGWSSVVKDVSSAGLAGDEAESLFESFDSRSLSIRVFADNIRFSLNLRWTLFENAASFYDQGKKAKQKAAGASVALEESRKKLAEVMRSIKEVEEAKLAKPAEVIAELTKRKVETKDWYEKFRWFISSDGFLVVAGKDSVSNEVLVKKHTKAEDAVFHAEITGAPFVVVKAEDKTPSEQALREAAEFAVSFSRGWREGMASVDVYWVKPEQLSKSGPSGESVPHGAFAVVGKRNWMRGTPLMLAIGVVEDEELLFVGGPLDAVRAKTSTYVAIKPGDEFGKQLLKDVLRTLSDRVPKEKRERVARASIELIREFVPYTRGRLTEAGSRPQERRTQ